MIAYDIECLRRHSPQSRGVRKSIPHPIAEISEVPANRDVGLERSIDVGIRFQVSHVGFHQNGADRNCLEVAPANFAIAEGTETKLRSLKLPHVARPRDHALTR